MQTACELLQRREVCCPICRGELTFHSCYRRHFKDNNGMSHHGWVAQGHCATCKKYLSLIPDFLMPYKHYETVVIETVLSESEERGGIGFSDCPADESTIRKWIRQFRERGSYAVGKLQSLLFTVYGQYVNMIELPKEGTYQQLSILVHKIIKTGGGLGVIGKANIILTRYPSGFL